MSEAAFKSYAERREQLRRWGMVRYVHDFNLTPCRMLDAGCGDGFWTELFDDAGFEPVGVDMTPAYLERARDRLGDRIEFTLADLFLDQPYPQHSFPLVFCRTATPLFSPDEWTVVRWIEILRSYVAPGGKLLIAVYSDGSGELRPNAGNLGSAKHWPVSDYERFIGAAGGKLTKKTEEHSYRQFLIEEP